MRSWNPWDLATLDRLLGDPLGFPQPAPGGSSLGLKYQQVRFAWIPFHSLSGLIHTGLIPLEIGDVVLDQMEYWDLESPGKSALQDLLGVPRCDRD